MADNADLAPGIPDAANKPASVTTDGLTVIARPIADQILADQYSKAARASRNPKRGLRFTKLIGPQQSPTDPGTDANTSDGSFF
jgi:hypothetical protein